MRGDAMKSRITPQFYADTCKRQLRWCIAQARYCRDRWKQTGHRFYRVVYDHYLQAAQWWRQEWRQAKADSQACSLPQPTETDKEVES